jgi:hypothetical protein
MTCRTNRQFGIGTGSLLAPGLIELGMLFLAHENRRYGRRGVTIPAGTLSAAGDLPGAVRTDPPGDDP